MKRTRERETGFEDWGGYMEAKMTKLEEQFTAEASKSGLKISDIFKDIAIFVNGYTVPSADELRDLMMRHGGTFHHYFKTNKTTHVIASNLPDSKLKLVKNLKVIKPSWIVDSIGAGKLLDHKDYLLFTNQSKTQPSISFKKLVDSAQRSPTKTASDKEFLSEFYNNSRLHLISTLGATFKEYVKELRVKELPLDGRKELCAVGVKDSESNWGEVVMHIDMDCFFVSVGLRDRPELQGKPVAVAHARGNKVQPRPGVDRRAEWEAYGLRGEPLSDTDSMSEIASCSYEARRAGVKNGMLLGRALQLCPELTTIPYDFESYKQVSYTLYDTVARYTVDIEAVSCDELLIDCAGVLSETLVTPLHFASVLRQEIKEKTGCACSAGIGANRLQARLATHRAKPAGQFWVQPDELQTFMASVPVHQLPGVGRSISHKLADLDISTCGHLQEMSLSTLQSHFGNKLGETLHLHSFGKDTKGLTFEKLRKSVSAEVNYGIRFKSDEERDCFMKQLSEEVCTRLNEIGMKTKCVTLKIMVRAKNAPEESAKFLGHGACDYFTKSTTLKSFVDSPSIILREVLSILKQFNVPSKELRGIGIQLSKLASGISVGTNIDKFFKSSHCKESLAVQCGSGDKKTSINEEKRVQKTNAEQSSSHVLNISFSQVDKEVLDALPDELKREIMEQFNGTKSKEILLKPTLTKKKAVEETKKSKQTIVRFCQQSMEEPPTPEEDLLLKRFSPEEMLGLIKQWVSSIDSPQDNDVSMFSSYLIQLVRRRDLYHVKILLQTFSREVERSNKEDWKSGYRRILDSVQASIISRYNAPLKIDPPI